MLLYFTVFVLVGSTLINTYDLSSIATWVDDIIPSIYSSDRKDNNSVNVVSRLIFLLITLQWLDQIPYQFQDKNVIIDLQLFGSLPIVVIPVSFVVTVKENTCILLVLFLLL